MNALDNSEEFYRRHLPHYQPPEATFFVTFRLAGSLPAEIIADLKVDFSVAVQRLKKTSANDSSRADVYKLRKRYFGKFDSLLDGSKSGPFWLKNPNVAKLVANAIHFRDGKEYDLLCYCIMPNHVHMVIDVGRTCRSNFSSTNVEEMNTIHRGRDKSRPTREFVLTRILRRLKGATSRGANKLLHRSGAFWQHESYDHVVRNENELGRIIEYVINNPVTAGFVKSWEKWKWTYVKM